MGDIRLESVLTVHLYTDDSSSQTVADAIVLGNVVSLCWRCRAWFGPSPTLAGTRGQQERDGAKGASTGRGRRASLASVSHRTAEGASVGP